MSSEFGVRSSEFGVGEIENIKNAIMGVSVINGPTKNQGDRSRRTHVVSGILNPMRNKSYPNGRTLVEKDGH